MSQTYASMSAITVMAMQCGGRAPARLPAEDRAAVKAYSGKKDQT